MSIEKGWPAEGRYELPPGFYISADEDFVYLWRRVELVATFGQNACPYLIKAEAEKYLRKAETKGEEKNETT